LHLQDTTVDVVATLWSGNLDAVVEGHKRRIKRPHVGIVVSRHVQQRHIESRDEVLEVVEWQVAARDDEVRPERLKLVPEKKLVDFVRDRENPQARTSFL
jgi:hypothetical protein